MVQTRSQRTTGKARRPASPKTSTLKEPARRGRKPAAEKPAPNDSTSTCELTEMCHAEVICKKPATVARKTAAPKAPGARPVGRPRSTAPKTSPSLLKASPRRSPKKSQILMPPKAPARRGRPPKALKLAQLVSMEEESGKTQSASKSEFSDVVCSDSKTIAKGKAASAPAAADADELLRTSSICFKDSLLALPPKSPSKSAARLQGTYTPLFQTPKKGARMSVVKEDVSCILKSPPKSAMRHAATPRSPDELGSGERTTAGEPNVEQDDIGQLDMSCTAFEAALPLPSPTRTLGMDIFANVPNLLPSFLAIRSPFKTLQVPRDADQAIEQGGPSIPEEAPFFIQPVLKEVGGQSVADIPSPLHYDSTSFIAKPRDGIEDGHHSSKSSNESTAVIQSADSPSKSSNFKAVAVSETFAPKKSAMKTPRKTPQTPKGSMFGEPVNKSPIKTVTFESPLPPLPTSPARSPAKAAEPILEKVDEVVPNQLLKGAVFFVDVNSADGQYAGDIFVPLLMELGARCLPYLTKEVTHVLFKDGTKATVDQVLASDGTIKCVNLGWALDCERYNEWMKEADYAVDLSQFQSPKKPLSILSANATPAVTRTPAMSYSFRSAFGTPSTVFKPKLFVTPSKTLLNSDDKENVPTPDCTESPSTPYFLHPEKLVQMTCPPKQTQQSAFANVGRPEPFQQRMAEQRRKTLFVSSQQTATPVKPNRLLF